MAELSQGAVFWLDEDEPFGSEPGYRRPWVVVQNNVLSATRWGTVLACPISTNLRLAAVPGHIRLREGEGGLNHESVVLTRSLSARDRRLFLESPGSLSRQRVQQIVRVLTSFLEPREP